MAPIEPRQFMLYWTIGLITLLLLIFRRPRHRGGLRLRLRGRRVTGPDPRLAGARHAAAVVDAMADTDTSPIERPLNVVFQFNGETWDAYEVLGLPAGSSLEMVRAAYREATEAVDQSSRPFVDAAYFAITAAAEPR